jgi:hypothetical protein
MSDHGSTNATPAGAGHEASDLSTRLVVIFASALVVGAVAVFAAIWLLFLYFGDVNAKAYPREYPLAQVGPPPEPPAPRLQDKPREDLKRLRAEEDAVLHGYGWVDPARGVAYIPIDRAVDLVLQQGLPARAQR